MPQAVIGDFDSLSDLGRAAIPATRQHVIPEQDTTDFDKALRSIRAPFVLGLGFSGRARGSRAGGVPYACCSTPASPA